MLIDIVFALVEQDQYQMHWLLGELNKLVPYEDQEDGKCTTWQQRCPSHSEQQMNPTPMSCLSSLRDPKRFDRLVAMWDCETSQTLAT